MYIVKVKEPKQYRTTYSTTIFSDVVTIKKSKDGFKTTLVCADGYKTIRQTRLIESIEEVTHDSHHNP